MNWADVNAELGTLLQDTDEAALSYPLENRLVAFNRAQDYFAATHTALLKRVAATATATASSGDSSLLLPSDLIQIAGIQVDDTWLEPNLIVPGGEAQAYGFLITDQGIYLPGGDEALELWYYAMYPSVSSDTSPVYLPRWAEWAVINLAFAYILYPDMIGQASLRRFQSRRDAGSPEDNPPRQQARFHFDQYQQLVSRVKPQDREILFKPGR